MKLKSLLAPLLLALVLPFSLIAADAVVKLPAPQTDGGKPLMAVLKARKSSRVYDAKPLALQELSNLLWAGFGINRPETGDRTAPTANDRQEFDLYVTLQTGAYVYDAKDNLLRPVASGDLRALTGTQPFVKNAPCDIVIVADHSREKEGSKHSWAEADAGFISENLYLYCASAGLATVVRASVDKPELAKALKLKPTQEIIFCQSVGKIKS